MKANKAYYKKIYATLEKITRKPYRNLIKELSNESITCICEALFNFIDAELNLNKKEIKKIKNFFKNDKQLIRTLAKKDISISKKRKILNNE